MGKLLKLSDIDFFSLAVIVLLIFIPLYPKFPLFFVPGTYVAIRLEDFLVGLIVLFWFLSQIRRRFSFFRERVAQLIILYWLVGLLSLISATMITKNILPHLAFLHWLRRVEYMALFFVALSSIKSLMKIKSYAEAILIAASGVIIYGIGQKFFGWPVVSTMNEEFSKGILLQLTEWTRVNSTFAGHYDLAAYLVMILAVMAAFFIYFRERWLKWLILLVAVFSFYLLILTASRVSFGAYLLGISFVLFFAGQKKWIIPIIVISLGAMSISGDLNQRFSALLKVDLSALSGQVRLFQKAEVKRIAIITSPTPSATVAPVASTPLRPTTTPELKVATGAAEEWPVEPVELAAQRSGAIRFDVEWPRSWRAFLKNPFLGTGYSSVTLATDNDYLRALAETGLLGFLAFALIFLEIARQTIVFLRSGKNFLAKIIVIGFSGAAIGILVNASFIDVFEASKVAFIFWILMGIMMGIEKTEEEKLAHEKSF